MKIGDDLLVHRFDSVDDTAAVLNIGPPSLVAVRA